MKLQLSRLPLAKILGRALFSQTPPSPFIQLADKLSSMSDLAFVNLTTHITTYLDMNDLPLALGLEFSIKEDSISVEQFARTP